MPCVSSLWRLRSLTPIRSLVSTGTLGTLLPAQSDSTYEDTKLERVVAERRFVVHQRLFFEHPQGQSNLQSRTRHVSKCKQKLAR